MKAEDVVTQLAVLLPQLTDVFTTNSTARAVTRSGTEVTVDCLEEHGLEVGNAVALEGAITQIAISSLTRAGTVGTLVTAADHDLTNPVAATITISGATEAEFNGTFTRINVENRRTITFEMTDAGPTTATGSPVLQDGESALRQYDGTYLVQEVLSPTSFTIQNANTTMLDPIGTIAVRGRPRIARAVDPERLFQAYSEQGDGELWLFVALDDVSASKSRTIRSDAIDNMTAGDFFRQQIIESVTLYLFVPAHADIGAGAARDIAQGQFRNICRAVLAAAFDSGLHVGKQGRLQFVTHGTFRYNTSVYAHGYNFQQVVDLYEEDTVGPDLDVAFRNLNFSMDPDLTGSSNTTALTASLDLDDAPL